MIRNCPICKTPVDSYSNSEFPFCSERCRLLDLGAWASEKYVVSEPVFDEEELPEGTPKTVILDLPERDDTTNG
jgi:endogenous inhibitor of DNA gyrase (YacG/DUF329 family)